MSWKTDFQDYDGEFFCPEGWVDESWHNDVCPHIEKRSGEIAVLVWQNYVAEDLREFKERYSFQIEYEGECIYDYPTDDLEKIKELMKRVAI